MHFITPEDLGRATRFVFANRIESIRVLSVTPWGLDGSRSVTLEVFSKVDLPGSPPVRSIDTLTVREVSSFSITERSDTSV